MAGVTLRRQGFEPRVDFEASDVSTHLAFAAAGLAAALVPRLAMDRTPEGWRWWRPNRACTATSTLWRADNAGPAVRAGIDAVGDAFGRRRTQFRPLRGSCSTPRSRGQ
ncbi:hypothetical protein GTG23_04725 [Rhodococcus hoagii]|nr:hypothetical protein [Prescottella equi]